MTEEQINKAGSEYAKSQFEMVEEIGGDTYYLDPEQIREDFIEGANFANNYWQEKTRWIPVTERLPEIKKKGYWVLVKDGKKADPETFNISEARDIEVLENWFTHWKEII